MNIKYVHTNLVAEDWRKLAQFYIDVFGCKPQYPERDLAGKWIDQMTAIDQVRIKGIHLLLPGYDHGPTLEIFSYDPANERNEKPTINTSGFGHIAFHVDDVAAIARVILNHGGKMLGEIVQSDYGEIGVLTAGYAQDPEGNFLEIQNWRRS